MENHVTWKRENAESDVMTSDVYEMIEYWYQRSFIFLKNRFLPHAGMPNFWTPHYFPFKSTESFYTAAGHYPPTPVWVGKEKISLFVSIGLNVNFHIILQAHCIFSSEYNRDR